MRYTWAMAFDHNLPKAAFRNLEAAEILANGTRRDVAGYLYGIAAECAVKAMVEDVPHLRRDEIFFAHFPELRTLLRDALGRRTPRPLLAFIQDDSFLNNWNVKMRYADARQILDKWVTTWAEQARHAVNAMGT